MKTFKRIITSILRNPFQTVLMFLIVFVLGNVLFASIAVKQSSENVRQELRTRTASYITLIKTHDGDEANNYRKIKNLVKDLETNETIRSVEVLETIEIYDPIEITKDHSSYDVYNFVSLENIEDSFYDYDIVEGRYFTQEELDRGDRKILVDKWMGYEVGDTITFSIPDYEVILEITHYNDTDFISRRYIQAKMENRKTYEFEVIGLYESVSLRKDYEEESDNLYIGYEISKHCMEEMVELHQNVMNDHSDSDKAYLRERSQWIDEDCFEINNEISAIMISTKGIDANEQLEKELLENPNYPSYYYKMKTAAQEYRYIQGPLENLDALANVALGASVILTIVLLTLVSNLFIKYRTKEIGILMAIGEKKSRLLAQFVGEILIVGLLATSCAMMSGNFLGNNISNEFMKIQIDLDSEMEYQESNPDELTQIDLLEAYEIEMNTEYIVTIYLVSTLILMVSTALPVINILKVNPKDVLI